MHFVLKIRIFWMKSVTFMLLISFLLAFRRILLKEANMQG